MRHPEGARRELGGRVAPGAAQPAGGWRGGRSGGLLWVAGKGRGVEERFRKVKRRENRLNDTVCVIEVNPQENLRK